MLVASGAVLLVVAWRLGERAGAGGRVAHSGLDVHVPADLVPLRPEARSRTGLDPALAVVLLPAAERLLPAVSGRRLQDVLPAVLQRRPPPHLHGRRPVDLPRRRPADSLPAGLSGAGAGSGVGGDDRGPRAVSALAVPALPPRLGDVPHRRRHPAPVRVQPAGDAPLLFPRVELHGLLAPDQHLLEGLHDEGLLLSGVLRAQEARRDHGAGRSPRSWSSRSPGRCTRTRRSGFRAASCSRGTTCCSGALLAALVVINALREWRRRPAAAVDGPRACPGATRCGRRRPPSRCSARSACCGRCGAPSR